MQLVQRAKDMLLAPSQTWPQIDREPTDARSLYTDYVVVLAAIPVVAAFIGTSLVGMGAFGIDVRVPLVPALVRMVVSYALSLAMVFVMALVVDALAPLFGGRKSQISALKLVAYGSTAAFVGGIFNVLPTLSILGLFAAAYSIYLVYLGLPVMMKCAPEKAGAYTAAVVVCSIVAGIVLGAVSAAVLPMHTGVRTVGIDRTAAHVASVRRTATVAAGHRAA